MAQSNGREIVTARGYATAADFKQIFTENVDHLFLLSFLLTGDQQKAEECFVAGIEESAKGNRVFKEWARSWARRAVIQSAIRLIAPRERSVTAIRDPDIARAIGKIPLLLHAEVTAILDLENLERFVFVMSVLERYSDHDCAILLGCARREIITVRARAVQQLGALLGLGRRKVASSENSAAPEDVETVIELTIAQLFPTPLWTSGLSR